jgi:hypothetical protein
LNNETNRIKSPNLLPPTENPPRQHQSNRKKPTNTQPKSGGNSSPHYLSQRREQAVAMRVGAERKCKRNARNYPRKEAGFIGSPGARASHRRAETRCSASDSRRPPRAVGSLPSDGRPRPLRKRPVGRGLHFELSRVSVCWPPRNGSFAPINATGRNGGCGLT